MKKIVFSLLILLSILAFWIIEPYSNNPFHQSVQPSVKISVDYRCSFELEDVTNKIAAILNEYMLSGDFLGISAGFFIEGCGSLTASSEYRDKWDLALRII